MNPPSGEKSLKGDDAARGIIPQCDTIGASVNKQLTNTPHGQNIDIDIDSTPTVVLGIRIPYNIYLIYKKFDKKKKKILKRIVAAAILGLENKVVETPRQNIFMSVNISEQNSINVNSNVNSVNVDPHILKREIKILKEEKRRLMEIVDFYEREIDKYKRDLDELQRRLREARGADVERLMRENKDLRRSVKSLKSTIRYALEYFDKNPRLAKKLLREADNT